MARATVRPPNKEARTPAANATRKAATPARAAEKHAGKAAVAGKAAAKAKARQPAATAAPEKTRKPPVSTPSRPAAARTTATRKPSTATTAAQTTKAGRSVAPTSKTILHVPEITARAKPETPKPAKRAKPAAAKVKPAKTINEPAPAAAPPEAKAAPPANAAPPAEAALELPFSVLIATAVHYFRKAVTYVKEHVLIKASVPKPRLFLASSVLVGVALAALLLSIRSDSGMQENVSAPAPAPAIIRPAPVPAPLPPVPIIAPAPARQDVEDQPNEVKGGAAGPEPPFPPLPSTGDPAATGAPVVGAAGVSSAVDTVSRRGDVAGPAPIAVGFPSGTRPSPVTVQGKPASVTGRIAVEETVSSVQGLDEATVRKVVAKVEPLVKSIYQSELNVNPGTNVGKLIFRLNLRADGSVEDVELIQGGDRFSYAIKERMKYILKTLVFPALGAEVGVDVPFNLVAVHSN